MIKRNLYLVLINTISLFLNGFYIRIILFFLSSLLLSVIATKADLHFLNFLVGRVIDTVFFDLVFFGNAIEGNAKLASSKLFPYLVVLLFFVVTILHGLTVKVIVMIFKAVRKWRINESHRQKGHQNR